MSAIRNKVQLIGNLGQEPEVRTTENGKKLARSSIATNDTYRNGKGGRVTDTTWHNVIAWGKLADITERYLTKGKQVAISGKLVHHSYIDKNGIKRYVTEIVLNELLMLGGAYKTQVDPQVWEEDVITEADAEMEA